MEQSTVAEHLERLERDGFVRRRRAARDRRKFGVYLTPKGRTMAPNFLEGLESGAQIFTAGIARQDLATFDRVIRQIIERLENFIEETERSADQRD